MAKKRNRVVGHKAWTTHDEKSFIEQLGSHKRNSLPRSVLLVKYLHFMTHVRVNFGAIDKNEVIAFTQKVMRNEGIN